MHPESALQFTNLDKPLWPDGTSKGRLIEYLLGVAPQLLPHLAGRPLTVKRFPGGSEKPGFFEKHAPAHRPDWVSTVVVDSSEAGPIEYVLVDRPQTLAWLGQIAAVELHVPLHRAQSPACPDVVAFDLDPGEGAGLVECCEVALLLREFSSSLGLDTVVKTSGSKGMQVYLPLNNAAIDYPDSRRFAKQVAEAMESELPQLVVARQPKVLRAERVLIDWQQNDPSKTTISVYSARPGRTASVSVPLLWSEVEAARAAEDAGCLRFGFDQVQTRAEEHGDLFARALTARQVLPDLG